MNRPKKPWPLNTSNIKSLKKKPNKTLLFQKGYENGWSHNDVLFVQEEWRINSCSEDGELAIEYKADARSTPLTWVRITNDPNGDQFEAVWREVCDELIKIDWPSNEDGGWSWPVSKSPLAWKEPHTMPEWASRFQFSICGWRTIDGSDLRGRGINKKAKYTAISLIQSEDFVMPDAFAVSTFP